MRTSTLRFPLALALAALLVAVAAWGVHRFLPRQEALPTLALQSVPVEQITRKPPRAEGHYRVAVAQDGAWRDAGTLEADKYLRTQTLALDGLTGNTPVRVRIQRSGGGEAHLDALLLNGQSPLSVTGAELQKLGAVDNDLTIAPADAPDAALEATFAAAALRPDGNRLTVAARIAPHVLTGFPIRYPQANQGVPTNAPVAFAPYTLGSNPGHLTLDGDLVGEGLGTPLFSVNPVIASGHPRSPMYGWVRDDGTTLYAALDFTGDNTMDGDADWAALSVQTPAGVRTFRVSVPAQQWGQPGFTYTDKVGWQHKVYEFAIPLAELWPEGAPQTAQVSFAAYGTAASIGTQTNPSLAYNPFLNNSLLAYQEQIDTGPPGCCGDTFHVFIAFVSGLGVLQSGSELDLTPEADGNQQQYPLVAFNPYSNRYLVAWYDTNSAQVTSQAFEPDGTAVGNPIMLPKSESFSPYQHRVAADPLTGQFLVLWSINNGDGANIEGVILDEDGALVTTSTQEWVQGTSLDDADSPAVVFDPVSERYVLVYVRPWFTGDPTYEDIRGQRIQSNGTLAGSPFTVAERSADFVFYNLELAGDPESGYLTAGWTEYTGSADEVHIQSFMADGTLVDHLSDTDSPPTVNLNTGSGYASSSLIGFNGALGSLRVLFNDGSSNLAAFGLNSSTLDTETPVTPSVILDGTYVTGQTFNMTENHFCGNETVAWQTGDGGAVETGIGGNCNPPVPLLTFMGNAPGGVAAVDGQSVTFRVRYWGSGLPDPGEVMISAPDGVFFPATGATVGPAGGGGAAGSGGPPAGLIAGLGALLAGLLLIAAGLRTRRLRPGMSLATLVLGVALVVGGLSACSTSSSGGGGGGSDNAGTGDDGGDDGNGDDGGDTGDTTATFAMNGEDGDGETLDGRVYEITVDLPGAGTYSYHFAFAQDGQDAYGLPTQENAVTVE